MRKKHGKVEARARLAELIRNAKRRRWRVYRKSSKNCNFRRISAVIEWQKIREFVSLAAFAGGAAAFFRHFQGGRRASLGPASRRGESGLFFGRIPVIQASISATRETAARFSPILHAQARMYKLLSSNGNSQPVSAGFRHFRLKRILLFITGPWQACPSRTASSRNERHLIYALSDALIHAHRCPSSSSLP